MIQVLLFIIKIVGWFLLGILGLILGIIFAVLFSAIRYQIDGSKQEKLSGKIHVTWLLWIFSITVCYEEKLHLTVKLFGQTVWKPRKKEDEEFSDSSEDLPEITPGGQDDSLHWMPEDETNPEGIEEKEDEIPPKAEEGEQKHRRRKRKSSRTVPLRQKIDRTIQKLQRSFQTICDKVSQIQDKVSWAKQKGSQILTYLEDVQNQKSAKLIIRQIKKILRYLLPRKGTISITFGRDDSYLMGKVLTYASFLYPFTHKFFTLHPVFGENILEGEVHVCGHIRIGRILGMVLRLLFDRNIGRQLWQFVRPKKKKKKERK